MPDDPAFSHARERAFGEWRVRISGPYALARDVTHEVFCAGWDALAALLGNDHYVIFTEDGWTTEHSLDCRLSGQMHRCPVHDALARIAARYDPRMAGRWLVKAVDSDGLPQLERPGTEVARG